MDYSTPGSSLHGILQERILATVAMPSSGDLYDAHTHTHTNTLTHTLIQTHTHTQTRTHTHTALSEPTGYLASVVLDSLQTL